VLSLFVVSARIGPGEAGKQMIRSLNAELVRVRQELVTVKRDHAALIDEIAKVKRQMMEATSERDRAKEQLLQIQQEQ
jgi:hypothetical protein